MIVKSRHRNPVLIAAVTAGLLAAAMIGGCGEKKEAAAPPTAGTATGPGGQPERRVTTGADPQKAPPYPGMYGAPAGSR